jgi:hypothetical protein
MKVFCSRRAVGGDSAARTRPMACLAYPFDFAAYPFG